VAAAVAVASSGACAAEYIVVLVQRNIVELVQQFKPFFAWPF
jgi:hypothetical protein